MSYLLLIMERADRRRGRPDDVVKAEYDDMMRFTEDLAARGLFNGAASLSSVSQGARVEKRNGKQTVLDGPFAEAKEIVGGFIHIECTDKTQALAIAAQCPATAWASVEVREVGPCSSEH